jgi:antitoxin PrlF
MLLLELRSMAEKSYKASWAKIGNSSGYRLPSEFFRDNPDFVGADGTVQVIAPNTVLFNRALPDEMDEEDDAGMMKLYLDFLIEQAIAHPEELEEYTEQMIAEDQELMAGVILDGD